MQTRSEMDQWPKALVKFVAQTAKNPPITPQVKVISELEKSGGESYTRHKGIVISQVMPDACIYFSIEDLVKGCVPLQLTNVKDDLKLYVINSSMLKKERANLAHVGLDGLLSEVDDGFAKIAQQNIVQVAADAAGLSDEIVNYDLNIDSVLSMPSHNQTIATSASNTNTVNSTEQQMLPLLNQQCDPQHQEVIGMGVKTKSSSMETLADILQQFEDELTHVPECKGTTPKVKGKRKSTKKTLRKPEPPAQGVDIDVKVKKTRFKE